MNKIETCNFLAEGEPTVFTDDKRPISVDWKIWEISRWERQEGKDVAFKGDLFADGFIKWDGCSNWSFHTETCMFHACDRERLVAIGEALAKCWDESAVIMEESWNE